MTNAWPKPHLLSRRTLDQVERDAAALRSLDLRTTSLADVGEAVRNLCDGYTFRTQPFRFLPCFRARILPAPPRTIGEMWYPPAHCVGVLGRANDAQQAIFYGAQSETGALVEIRASAGDTVAVLGADDVHTPQPAQLVDVGLPELVRFVDGSRPRAFGETLTCLRLLRDEDNVRKLALIRSTLVSQFTRHVLPGCEHEYKVSLAIANLLLESGVDGIVYPGAGSDLKLVNFALKPDAANRVLRPAFCRFVRVEGRMPNGGFILRLLATAAAISSNGALSWQPFSIRRPPEREGHLSS